MTGTRCSAAAFDVEVAPGGYVWWYLDALSDDGTLGLTIIAFIGSVFSPYYAAARRRRPDAPPDATDHCAVNVALYGRTGARWSMTERGRAQLQRDAHSLQIGPSGLRWEDDTLVIRIDEVTVPLPSRLRGTVRVQVPRCFEHTVELAPGHRWRPIAPSARVEVDLGGQRWAGPGYLDSNHGDEPLERAFKRWDWSRAQLAGGHSVVLYDVEPVAATPRQIGLRFDAGGAVEEVAMPAATVLPATGWRVARHARGDEGEPVRLRRTLTDAPFYARSVLEARWLGEHVDVMHESLSLARFDARWVQVLLPFRMPRSTR